MEVILKKYKISTSIMKQSLISNINDLENCEVLGWCIFNKTKYIVLYNELLGILTKYHMPREIIILPKYHENLTYEIHVKFYSNYSSLNYNAQTETEKDNLFFILNKVKDDAINKGQFYL
jgi:hypothetical protein